MKCALMIRVKQQCSGLHWRLAARRLPVGLPGSGGQRVRQFAQSWHGLRSLLCLATVNPLWVGVGVVVCLRWASSAGQQEVDGWGETSQSSGLHSDHQSVNKPSCCQAPNSEISSNWSIYNAFFSPTRQSIITAFPNVLRLTLLFRPLEAVMLSGDVVCRGINCDLVPSQVPSWKLPPITWGG